jgi:hypothetical protein
VAGRREENGGGYGEDRREEKRMKTNEQSIAFLVSNDASMINESALLYHQIPL